MVGYNRRYSEPVREIGRLFAGRTEPLAMYYRVNAGYMPPTHWAQAADQGGRIIGEGGHFIDVLQYLCGAQPTSVYAIAPTDPANRYRGDNVLVSISFADGSAGTIHYLANGAPAVEKEYLEVFGDGKTARMWNFKKVECADGQKLSKRSYSGDKGHAAEMKALVDAVQSGGQELASLESLAATSRVTFAIAESLRTAVSVRL
jgi:predicted dehydrogenase